MNLISLQNNKPSYTKAVTLAVNALQKGEVIALPTDTLYGLAVLARYPKALDKLCTIKQRSLSQKPVSLCISTIKDIYKFSFVTVPESLLNEFLPGPYTLLFQRKNTLYSFFNPQANLIGFRIPKSEFIQKVCENCGEPLALTSANVSDGLSPLDTSEFCYLHSKIAYIFDQGKLEFPGGSRAGSTIIDLSTLGHFEIIRQGICLEKAVNILQKYNLKSQ